MAAALAVSTGDEECGPVGCLPNLLTSRANCSRTTSWGGGADPDGKRRAPACSAIQLPEELEALGDARRAGTTPGLCVRNTFIHTAARRSPSLEGFYRERGVVTCPSARIGLLEGLFREGRSPSPDAPALGGLPDTPCNVETPSWVSTVRTPCSVDAPLLSEPPRDWHPMSSYAAMEAWSHSGVPTYMAQGASMTDHYAPCVDAQHYYTGMAPQVHVESVAVSAVGHLACEAPLPALSKARTVVKLADSLQLGMSANILEGLGVACGHAGASSAQPAEGYLSEFSWSRAPGPPAPSQPSPWATQPAYGGVERSCAPLYSAPPRPPALSHAAEAWGACPDMPAPLLSPGVAPMAARAMPSPPSRPALGTDELPSLGSQAHALGTCKPCAFLHTKGCENGLSCQFCHLCESGEKKRRRKAKLESQRTVRKTKQSLFLTAYAERGNCSEDSSA